MSPLSARENILRAILFQTPESVPVTYKINPSYYFTNDVDAVLDFQTRHPLLFPDFVKLYQRFLKFADCHSLPLKGHF